MLPEQIPGSLFVIILLAMGLALQEYEALFLLALGCAAGWQTFNPSEKIAGPARIVALLFWTVSFILLAERIFL